MADNILIFEDKHFALELDENKSIVYFYNLNINKVQHSSKSILIALNKQTIQEVNKKFGVDITDYGVQLEHKHINTLSKEEKEEVYKNKYLKYLMIFIILILSLFHENIEPNLDFMGYFLGFILSIVILFVLVDERDLKNEFMNKHRYNIRTKPLPTKEQQLDILEEKIDILLKDKTLIQTNTKLDAIREDIHIIRDLK